MTRILHTACSGFESARQLPSSGSGAAGLHGHSFLAKVRASLPAGLAAFEGDELACLQSALERCTARLDRRLLNELIPAPSDEALARWIAAEIGLPGVLQVGIQSTRQQGVDLDPDGHAELWRRFVFQAAHRLPNVPAGHKCGRMHGHGFEVVVHARALPGGRPIDHDLLDAAWAPLHFELNYGCLNDLPGLANPTSEVMSSWIWQRLQPTLPELAWVTVYETASCGANFDGQQYRIWKDFTLDSAVQLRRAPEGSALRRLHGHTYQMRLHLAAPLDQVMGWTVDFGDVKELFSPIFKSLDHQPLYELPGLADCDSASLASYILDQARAVLPAVDRVDLHETRGNGAIVMSGHSGPALPI
jgi:6-pyruvoyltetrahydropterin/6-carboxytetrahydropterin synthase